MSVNRRNAQRQRQLLSDFPANQGEQYDHTIAVAANYPAAKYPVILATGGAGGITIQLPSAAANPFKVYYIKKVDAGVGTVTVQRAGADTLDGAVSVVLATQYHSTTIVSDGVATWHLLTPAGWGGGGVVPPTGYCWLYCMANRTTYGGTGAAANIVSPGGDDNTALGFNALHENALGDKNVAVGSYALQGQVGQDVTYNVAVGYMAGYNQGVNEDGAVCIGCWSSYDCESDESVIIGDTAAFGSGVGTSKSVSDVFIGVQAGFDIRDASFNVAVGSNAMHHAEDGSGNVCVGDSAGYGSNNHSWTLNTFVGGYAGFWAETGCDDNVCVGHAAGGSDHFTGEQNVIIGFEACNSSAALSGDYNVVVGAYAAGQFTTATRNVITGYMAAESFLQTGTDNVFEGYYAGKNLTGSKNVVIGSQAGEGPFAAGNTATRDVIIGFQAGTAITTGSDNTFVGYMAGRGCTVGYNNVCVGYGAGLVGTTFDANVIVGYNAGVTLDQGFSNVLIGQQAGNGLVDGDNNICIGYLAGDSAGFASATRNILIGSLTGAAITTTATENIIIGFSAGGALTSADYNVFIGAYSGDAVTTQTGHTFVGYQSGQANTSGQSNTFLGHKAGHLNTTSSFNVYVGTQAGRDATGGSNVYVGDSAGITAGTAEFNVLVGAEAGNRIIDGVRNVCIGYEAGFGTLATSYDYNVFIGYDAGYSATTGGSNVAVGYCAAENMTSALRNVLIGKNAGQEVNAGSNNVCVGFEAGLGVAANDYNYNVFVGFRSGVAVTTGGYNTLTGYQSGQLLTTGTHNTCIGLNAGDIITTGGYNLCLGQNTDPPAANSIYRMNIGNTIYADMGAPKSVGINVSTILGQLHVDQDEVAGARPVLYLDQGDADQEFIHYQGTVAADQTTNISSVNGDGVVTGPKDYASTAGWSFNGMIRINVQGTDRWFPYYREDTS